MALTCSQRLVASFPLMASEKKNFYIPLENLAFQPIKISDLGTVYMLGKKLLKNISVTLLSKYLVCLRKSANFRFSHFKQRNHIGNNIKN